MRLDLDQLLKLFQAFVVAGGHDGTYALSSVVTLLPGATAWTNLASLPRPLHGAPASIVAGPAIFIQLENQGIEDHYCRKNKNSWRLQSSLPQIGGDL